MLLCNTTTLSIRREKKQLTCCVTYVLHTERKRERERRVGSHVFHSSFFFSCSYSPSLHLPSFTRSSSWDAWPESLPQLCCKCAPVRSAFSTSPVLFEFLVSPFFFSLSLSLPPKAHTHTQTDRHSIEKLKKAIPFFSRSCYLTCGAYRILIGFFFSSFEFFTLSYLCWDFSAVWTHVWLVGSSSDWNARLYVHLRKWNKKSDFHLAANNRKNCKRFIPQICLFSAHHHG